MGVSSGESVYRFGAFELFARRQLLTHSGTIVPISSSSLAMLSLLVARAGDLVTKHQLISVGWPSTFVHEGSLKVGIAGIRRALEAHAPEQEFIKTISGQGYRFTAPVQSGRTSQPNLSGIKVRTFLPSVVPLIGRVEDQNDLCATLATHGFVTLTGTGGVGKTALAVAVGHALRGEHLEASFIDLSVLAANQHLPAAMVAELGIRSDSADLLGAVIHALLDRPRLIILDNCEHLLPGVALVAERLASELPNARILATSREPLGLARERLFSLSPLKFPHTSILRTEPGGSYDFPAIRLFLARAKAVRSDVQQDFSAIAEICERLDGLPLAIELAAAQCIAYSPSELLELLRKRLDLPDEPAESRPPRQRGLRATLDWSYGLLRPNEAAVFRALAVFARPFSLEEAIAIAAAANIGQNDAAQCVLLLNSKSLLSSDDHDGLLRYRFLDSTRAFACERLSTDHRRDRVERCHAERLCLALEQSNDRPARALGNGMPLQDGDWSADVRRALIWAAAEQDRAEIGVRITLAAIPLWERLSLLDESIVHLTSALEKVGRRQQRGFSAEARLQTAFAVALFNARGVNAETEAAWRRARALAEECGDEGSLVQALWGTAAYDIHAGRPAKAAERLTALISFGNISANQSVVEDSERLLAAAEMYLGDLPGAILRLDRLRAADLPDNHLPNERRFQVNRGSAIGTTVALLKWLTGDVTGAAQLVAETAAVAIDASHPVSICNIMVLSAIPIALFDDRLDDARRFVDVLEEQFKGRRLQLWAQMAACLAAALALRQGTPHGIERLQRAIDELINSGATIRVPALMGMLAQGQIAQGDIAGAEGTITTAIARALAQQEHWIMPELVRIHARLEVEKGNEARAIALLGNAIDAATRMKAGTWRRRAIADLDRLKIPA